MTTLLKGTIMRFREVREVRNETTRPELDIDPEEEARLRRIDEELRLFHQQVVDAWNEAARQARANTQNRTW